MKKLVFTEEDFLAQFNLPQITFQEFCDRVCVLDIMDRSGSFVVRSNLDTFVNRVSKKDNRKDRLNLYKEKLYKILVTDATQTLLSWFNRYGKLTELIDFYFDIPNSTILKDGVFSGRTNSKYGKICKNINFLDFYNTKKLYTTDSEYTFGLIQAMFIDFKLRNSLVGPAFFDHICQYENDSSQFWLDFMIGANRASIFNPATYKNILDNLFTGDTLFAPVMGWNAYQIAFYSSKFKNFVSTDVIPDVVTNGKLLHQEFINYQNNSIFVQEEKNIDLYLCPSECLEQQHGFVNKYKNSIDAVLLSPPYFDLEIYPSENQSFTNYSNYETWLKDYWEATVQLCTKVMKPNARFGFVISNYVNKDKQMTTISQDMCAVVKKHLTYINHYRIQWSAISSTRQSKKTKNGNFEDLWLFQK